VENSSTDLQMTLFQQKSFPPDRLGCPDLALLTPKRKLRPARSPHGRERPAMERRRAESAEHIEVARRGITFVAFEPVSGVKLRLLSGADCFSSHWVPLHWPSSERDRKTTYSPRGK